MFNIAMVVLAVYLCFAVMAAMNVCSEISQDGQLAALQRWNESSFYGQLELPYTYFGLIAVVVLTALAVPIEMLFRSVRPVK